MSEENFEQTEPVTLHELTEVGREKLAEAQDGAKDALGATTEYLKANPWTAVAGAAVIGGVLVALLRPSRPKTPNMENLRDWMGEAVAKLPSQRDVQAMAKSSGAQKLLKQWAKSLHLAT